LSLSSSLDENIEHHAVEEEEGENVSQDTQNHEHRESWLRIRKYEKLADDLSVLVFFCSVAAKWTGSRRADSGDARTPFSWHRRHLALRLMDALSNEHFKRSAIR
jgi:hypothetical protein